VGRTIFFFGPCFFFLFFVFLVAVEKKEENSQHEVRPISPRARPFFLTSTLVSFRNRRSLHPISRQEIKGRGKSERGKSREREKEDLAQTRSIQARVKSRPAH
jgi:hypothetical protein